MSRPELRVVEEAVAGHPDVREVAAVAVDGGVAAGAVASEFASARDIREHAWAALGDRAAPRTVALLPALPRDGGGEVDRAELRRMLTGDDVPASTYVPPRPGFETELAAVLSEVLRVPRVGLDDQFLDLGGDSATAIDAVNLIADRTGIEVDLEHFFTASTVRDLAREVAG